MRPSRATAPVAMALVSLSALLAIPPTAARADVAITPTTITLRTPQAQGGINRDPFQMAYSDAAGQRVLTEIPGSPSSQSPSLQLPGALGAPPAAQTPTLYGPLTFTVGTLQLSAYQGGFWEGNLTGVATSGTTYQASRVLAAQSAGDGVRLTLSTTDPSGRQMVVTVVPQGTGALEVSATPQPATGVATVGDSFASAPDEAFRGFGGRHNALDQHGNAFYSWAEEENLDAGPFQHQADQLTSSPPGSDLFPNGPTAAYYPQPLFVSSHRYGFLIDQPDFARFRLDSDRPDAWQAEVGASTLRYIVAPGDGPQAIGALTALSGRQPVPPQWGLGPMLDRLYSSSAQTPYATLVSQDIAAIDRYRVPLTAYRVEGWDTIPLDQDRQIFTALHQRGIHPLVYFRAYVGKHANTTHGGEMLDYAAEHGYVATNAAGAPYTFPDPEEGTGALIDFTNPAAVAWWQGRIAAALDLGADGFMQDFGEQTLPDMHFHDGSTGAQMHNRYPVLYAQATRDELNAYQASHPGRSFFFFTRAGYTGRPGSAAYENANFPGDETTDWTHSSGLASLAPDMLNRAIGGAYGYGTDIGGYLDVTTPATTKELFLRWAAAAALTPVFRLHGSTQAGTHTPWSYDAQTLAAYIALSRLHLAAAPLIVRLWAEADATGVPPTRPLWLAYPGDPQAAKQDEEWLLGPDVLVAPVVTQGATTRAVYFPAGCWQSPDSGDVYVGPASDTVPAPLGSLPYFFHCGTTPFAAPPAAAAATRAIACVSRRAFTIHLPSVHGARVRDASVILIRRRLPVRAGRTRVVLRGLPRGRFVVRIVIRLRDGRTITQRRTYHTCVPGRRPRRHHRR